MHSRTEAMRAMQLLVTEINSAVSHPYFDALNKVRRASSRRRLSNEESLFTGRGGGRKEEERQRERQTRGRKRGAMKAEQPRKMLLQLLTS